MYIATCDAEKVKTDSCLQDLKLGQAKICTNVKILFTFDLRHAKETRMPYADSVTSYQPAHLFPQSYLRAILSAILVIGLY